MYIITCTTNGEEHVLMDMRDAEYTVESPVLILELNGAGSLSFRIYPNHPEFDCIHTLTSLVRVYKLEGSEKKWMFTGRVMTSQNDIQNTGKIDCEGILAFLCDSIIRPYEYDGGTPADYIRFLINSHNQQVNASKRFTIGALDVSDVDSNNAIYRANSNYPSTFSEMNDKVVKLLNTYISAKEENGKLIFDCVQTINKTNPQQIVFGENIINLNKTVEAEEIRTVMIGLGAADDDGNKPTVIVENAEAIAEYGRIEGLVEFENVGTLSQLTKKTEAYLDSVLGFKNTIEVKAIDLNMTDSDIEEISLGYAYIYSKPNNINNERMLISKLEIHMMQPENNSFTLGFARKTISSTLSHNSANLDGKIKQVAKTASKAIENKVENATQLITGAKGGYVILDCGEDAKSLPSQILIMDTSNKETASSVIRINKNGIGFSTTGYNGIYRNAWTIDGNLVADFVTTGTMLADRIRGGTLEVGGSGLAKDGSIQVYDLNDNLVATINKEGVDVYKGSVKGATIKAGGNNNQDGTITVNDSNNTAVVTINKDGINVLKGFVKGATIEAGGNDNTEGAIYIKDSSNNIKITIDCSGINVNDNFKISMDGKFTAVSVDENSGAWKQFSDLVDNSEAMRLAKDAIATAQSAANTANSAAATAKSAADKAQQTADTANSAAATAQSAANTANSAAATAQSAATTAQQTADTANSAAATAKSAADKAQQTVDDLNDTIIPKINKWINQLSDQIKELGKPGISDDED